MIIVILGSIIVIGRFSLSHSLTVIIANVASSFRLHAVTFRGTSTFILIDSVKKWQVAQPTVVKEVKGEDYTPCDNYTIIV